MMFSYRYYDAKLIHFRRQIFKTQTMYKVMNILGQSCDYADFQKILTESFLEITSSLYDLVMLPML